MKAYTGKNFFILMLVLSSFINIANIKATNIDIIKNAIKNARHDTAGISAQIELAEYLDKKNMLDSAYIILDEALTKCELLLADKKMSFRIENEIIKQKVQILLHQGSLYRKQGNHRQAIKTLNKSKKLSEKIDYKYGLAYSYYRIGEVKDRQGLLQDGLKMFLKSLKLFREIDNKDGIALSLNFAGVMYDFLGKLDTALQYYSESLKIYEELDNEIKIANQLNNIGIVYYLKGDFDSALDYYYQSIEIHERLGNIHLSYALTMNNIGLIYDNSGDILRAVDYYEKSLKVFETIKGLPEIVLPLNNLGDAYRKQNDYDKALEYFLNSLKIAKEMNDVQEEAHTLEKICTIYLLIDDMQNANHYCNKCLSIYRDIGDKHGIALAIIGVGKFHQKSGDLDAALEYYLNSIEIYKEIGDKQGISLSSSKAGNIYFIKKDYNRSYQYAQQSYDFAKETGGLSNIQSSARLLSRIYRTYGDFDKALQYYEEYVEIKDSIVNMDIRNRIQEQYYKYQYEKKAITDSIEFVQLMDITNLKLESQKAETERQRWVIYSILAGLVMVSVFSLIVLKLFIGKKTVNRKLELSNSEINQKNEEIISQRDQIKTQHEFVLQQNTLLEKSHQRITDSINYAKLIQTALLPSEKLLSSVFAEHLIFYKPSEIVSGDFYWIKEIDDKIYIVVADCTGHGVPGAFMSMLGIAFLNEITRRKNIKQTSDILNTLKQEVISSLNQENLPSKANEGINAGIIAIDKKRMNAQYSGAYSPMYLIRNNNEKTVRDIASDNVIKKPFKDKVFYELIGDKQTIAKSKKEKSFNTYSFKLLKGDSFYLFSDGYSDQLNGITNKRFTTRKFKNLLLKIHSRPMNQQYKILDITFNEWKNDNEQTDDVLIVGIKL